LSVAIPVHMRRGLFGKAPYIIMVGTDRTAFIPIDKKLYERIMVPYKQATYLDRLSGTMHAFSEYADTVAKDPLDQVISRYPGSFAVSNGEVVSFVLYIGRDEHTGRPEDHYSFEIRCLRGKYRGSVDKGMSTAGKVEFLRDVFGERFRMD